jgi:hypothetical protein
MKTTDHWTGWDYDERAIDAAQQADIHGDPARGLAALLSALTAHPSSGSVDIVPHSEYTRVWSASVFYSGSQVRHDGGRPEAYYVYAYGDHVRMNRRPVRPVVLDYGDPATGTGMAHRYAFSFMPAEYAAPEAP